MAFHSNLVEEIRRFNEETSAFISETAQSLRSLEALVENKLSCVTERKPSTISSGNDSNGRHQDRDGTETINRRERGELKRSLDEPGDHDSLIKKPRTNDERVDNEISKDAPKTIDDEMNGSRFMNINMNMGIKGTLEYLDQWLARVYDQTAKFYTIKKYNRMGTFLFYVAIDVNLDEAKDDIHVVINSDHLCRPDIIFRFIENCFQERKVVTLLHIVTNDEHQLREDPELVEKIITTMIEPVVVYL